MSVSGIGMQMLALGWLVGGAVSTLVGNHTTLVIAAALMMAFNVFVYNRSCEMQRSKSVAQRFGRGVTRGGSIGRVPILSKVER